MWRCRPRLVGPGDCPWTAPHAWSQPTDQKVGVRIPPGAPSPGCAARWRPRAPSRTRTSPRMEPARRRSTAVPARYGAPDPRCSGSVLAATAVAAARRRSLKKLQLQPALSARLMHERPNVRPSRSRVTLSESVESDRRGRGDVGVKQGPGNRKDLLRRLDERFAQGAVPTATYLPAGQRAQYRTSRATALAVTGVSFSAFIEPSGRAVRWSDRPVGCRGLRVFCTRRRCGQVRGSGRLDHGSQPGDRLRGGAADRGRGRTGGDHRPEAGAARRRGRRAR